MSENPYRPPGAALIDPATAPRERASRSARLGATLLDQLAFVLALVPVFFMVEAGVGGGNLAPWLIAISATLLGLLGVNLRLMRSGQTIGKRMLGIRVIRSNGEPLTQARYVLVRVLAVGLLAQVPFLGTLFALLDPLFIFRDDQRCIHDLIADTIVVQAEG